ncbi:hypothetical protein RvY_05414 [Ramazzottius varieornatus]|uniref:Uncharacterized protein n=1 Tax=Ramazzottius varieornatus TaxID=947166 RepID=A0A1D1UUZ3_RAMVA|nr:hypothetical protein RvY_05414 [Ramazzottius varieornatus]
MDIEDDPLDSNSSLAPLTPADTHCNPGALTDTFGFLIQLSLGAVAFAFLIIKRYCERRETRRPWLIWSFDTSKQVIASFVTHFGNILISEYGGKDPCSWYFINFMVDSTAGLVIIFLGLGFSNYIIVRFGWTFLQSGVYGSATLWSRIKSWVGQVFVYCLVSTVEKCITASLMVALWKPMQNLVILPHVNPKLEVLVVLLIIPFCVNVIVFWIIDNLLMRQGKKLEAISSDAIITTGAQPNLTYVSDHFNDSDRDDIEPLFPVNRHVGGASTSQHIDYPVI